MATMYEHVPKNREGMLERLPKLGYAETVLETIPSIYGPSITAEVKKPTVEVPAPVAQAPVQTPDHDKQPQVAAANASFYQAKIVAATLASADTEVAATAPTPEPVPLSFLDEARLKVAASYLPEEKVA